MNTEMLNDPVCECEEVTEELICPDTDFAQSETIIAKDCRFSLDDIKTRINNNILVVGGSGTGKTSTVVIPNLLQAVGSYIISDPKGNLYRKYADYLRKRGYETVNVDFTHPEKSAHYNPLMFVRNSQDILKIAEVIVNEKENAKVDPYWDAMTTILLSSVIGYMTETNYSPFNFSSILSLVREGTRKNEDTKESKLAMRFKRHYLSNPKSWACAQFEQVNAAPDKTYDTIRTTLAAKFAKFDTPELQQLMSGCSFSFDDIGKRRTAVFVTVSDTDRSMDSLANIFFTQAMQQLCSFADEQPDSRLPVPVRFFLDDFATNCRIEEFPRMISSIRSRGISVMLLIQAEAQLVQGYDADSETIIANCDTYAYLGGNDYRTAESVSKRCNKPVSQVLYMPVGSCWVFRRGSQPVYSHTLSPDERDRCIERSA